MTPEEHDARAMLIGAVWKEWLRCYIKKIGRHDGRPMSTIEVWLDDETMEELTHDERWQRLQGSINNSL